MVQYSSYKEESNMEEKINKFLNAFLNYHQYKNNLLFDNIKIFWSFMHFVNKQISSYQYLSDNSIDWYKVAKSTFLEQEKIIDSFYKDIGIDFKLDDIIKNGILEITTENLDDMIERRKRNFNVEGRNTYRNGHKSVEVYNSGVITNSVTWVHEISHYRNQPEKERNQVNNLFTEALAFTEELMYIDYLDSLGYYDEANYFKNNTFVNFYYFLDEGYPIVKIFLLYYMTGEVSYDNYKLYYQNNGDYKDVLKDFETIITDTPDIVFDIFYYTLAAALSIYMYDSYKKDNLFLNNVKRLNDNLDKMSVNECLWAIGLSGYNSESLMKIEVSFTNYINELEEKHKKTTQTK